MRLIGLVPAAGGGSRFGAAVPKQYTDVAGVPLVARTVQRLLEAIDFERIYIAVSGEDTRHVAALAPFADRVTALRCGGTSRAATVRNAIAHLCGACAEDDWLLVHDAARPCVPATELQALMREMDDEAVGGLLAIPVADTLKRGMVSADREVRVSRTEDRAGLWQAQTPQVFRFGILRRALDLAEAAEVTDEAQAVELLAAGNGMPMPRLVAGSTLNIKVTYPADVALAAAILAMQQTHG